MVASFWHLLCCKKGVVATAIHLDSEFIFIEMPIVSAPPARTVAIMRAMRLSVGVVSAALILPLLWFSVAALWGQAQAQQTDNGTLMAALTGISVNSALLFTFVTDFIAARTGYAD